MTDRYGSFEELRSHEVEGRDWSREYVSRGSRILVMAPHGGWIEPYTTELARAIAGDSFSFYTFQGLKDGGNRALHITSHRFDEPLALEAAEVADYVVAIHGERSGEDAFVMVGGGETELAEAVASALRALGIKVSPPRAGLGGLNPMNICNRGGRGPGIQLEMSEALRSHLRDHPGDQRDFVAGVRRVLTDRETRDSGS